MWRILRRSQAAGSELSESTLGLMQDTARNLILSTGIVYLGWHLVATIAWPEELGGNTWMITMVVAPTVAISLLLLGRHFLWSQGVWLSGLASAIALALYLFRQPEVAFLFAFLPSIAILSVGWWSGLVAQVGLGVLVWGLYALRLLPVGYAIGVTLADALAWMTGLISAHTLLTVTEWSLFSFGQAQKSIAEARQRRAQLAGVAKDLDLAYHRLERANAALIAARRVAEEAERFKAEFVTNVSHELRTPLNLIMGFSEMMIMAPESYDGVPLPGCYRSDLHAIYHSAQHLLALVDDVLDLSRIEAGKLAIARDQVDLASLVSEVIEMLRNYIAAKGLELRVQVPDDLPKLWLDRLRIRQVLLNLLVNSARFTERGWIAIEVCREEREVIVRVTDTGRGVPDHDLPKIFEEFRSTDQPLSAWHSGTGLGLPISKKFVELHGGRMGVDSTYGQGTAFWFTLPCRPNWCSLPQFARRTPERLGSAERVIVVAHDDPHIAPLLQRYIAGYRILSAPSLAEGARLAAEVEAVALVTEGEQSELVVGESAFPIINCPFPSSRRAAIVLGADDLLVKPVSRQDLLTAIDRIGRPVERVLIADDDPEVVRLFRRMLRTRFAARDCLEAYNGEEALQLIRASRPDLVLLDLLMPKLGGREVLEQMVADPNLADIPVLLVSARGEPDSGPRLRGPIQVAKLEGFELGEVVRTLEAIVTALAPGWQSPGSKEEAHAPGPAA